VGFTDEGAAPSGLACDDGAGNNSEEAPGLLVSLEFEAHAVLARLQSNGSYTTVFNASLDSLGGHGPDVSLIYDAAAQRVWGSWVGTDAARSALWLVDLSTNESRVVTLIMWGRCRVKEMGGGHDREPPTVA
jgi:hypothetical protein